MPPDARVAIVLADGEVPARAALDAAWPGWDAGTALVIAADGGARHAGALGLRVDRWIGDGDSIADGDLAALAATGARIDRVPAAKDATDTELALDAAIDAAIDAALDAARGPGADGIVLLGGLGGERVDHALANLALLEHPGLAGRRLVLFDGHAARLSLLAAIDAPATALLRGRPGDVVSLLPIGSTALGVTTAGLEYPLRDEPLMLGRTRGVSNVRTADEASITLESGRLLVIETPVTVDR